MWVAKNKRSKAAKRWHKKAMLVDPKKTEITIIWAPETVTYINQEKARHSTVNLKTAESHIVETIKAYENREDASIVSYNLGTNELKMKSSESDLCLIATSKEFSSEEPNWAEATNNYEADDWAYQFIAAEEGPLNLRFLRALEKTCSKWHNDKQLVKIARKMKRGKNLKRKEFDKVYIHIRNYCELN